MQEERINVASVQDGIAFVCHVCKYYWGMHTTHRNRLREAQALLHALKHVQEEHFHQKMNVIVYPDWLVEAVQSNKGDDDAEVSQTLQRCTSIYRALPNCFMRKCSSLQEVDDALQWSKISARMK